MACGGIGCIGVKLLNKFDGTACGKIIFGNIFWHEESITA